MVRLLPKGSMIRTVRGEDYHFIKFWYHPETRNFECPEKHKMGECKHCAIFTVKENEQK